MLVREFNKNNLTFGLQACAGKQVPAGESAGIVTCVAKSRLALATYLIMQSKLIGWSTFAS